MPASNIQRYYKALCMSDLRYLLATSPGTHMNGIHSNSSASRALPIHDMYCLLKLSAVALWAQLDLQP